MRIVYWILGMLAVAAGVLFLHARGPANPIWSSCLTSSALLVAGVLLCAACVTNYRGHWSLALGLFFLCSAAHSAGLTIDGLFIKSRMPHGVLVTGYMLLVGVLSLLASQKLHRQVVGYEGGAICSSSPDPGTMWILFWFLAILGFAVAFILFIAGTAFAGVPVLLMSLLLCVAAMTHYRGHWSFVVGMTLLCIAGVLAAFRLQSCVKGLKIASEPSSLRSMVIFGVCGVLSLWTAHKLHMISVQQARSEIQPKVKVGTDVQSVKKQAMRLFEKPTVRFIATMGLVANLIVCGSMGYLQTRKQHWEALAFSAEQKRITYYEQYLHLAYDLMVPVLGGSALLSALLFWMVWKQSGRDSKEPSRTATVDAIQEI